MRRLFGLCRTGSGREWIDGADGGTLGGAVGNGDEVGLWSMFIAWSIVNSSYVAPGVYVLRRAENGRRLDRKGNQSWKYSDVEKGVGYE